MANTRTAAKRAKQAVKRQTRNTIVKSITRTAVKNAVEAIKSTGNGKAETSAKDAYMSAVKALSKAASKGSIPKGRAARKISRLTLLLKKTQATASAK